VGTDDGPTGRGLALGSIAAGKFIEGMIKEILAPAIMGGDPLLTNDLWTKMYDAAPRRAGDGYMRSAIAALDFALWDIKGKALGVPVSRLFGGHREEIPTYANCAHHLPPDKLAERAVKDVQDGHKALKIRGTRPLVTPAEATARVQAVREAVGPDVKLMVDPDQPMELAGGSSAHGRRSDQREVDRILFGRQRASELPGEPVQGTRDAGEGHRRRRLSDRTQSARPRA
jgi:L-alanine-DL-glutamate epimerase-like enolase superfamily enzyme